MKKIFSLIIFLFIISCSKDKETPKEQNQIIQEESTSAKIQYSIDVSAQNGGSISTSGGTYDEGSEVTITATPDEGYNFIGWDGITETSSTITIKLNNDISIKALFDAIIEANEYNYNQVSISSPPFGGTIFITGNIITSEDPSTFETIKYIGAETRVMYDRRNGGAWATLDPYLFDTTFSDGLKTEIQINPEFSLDQATTEANKYAFLIGQLSKELRKDVETVWVHKGVEGYGGGNNNILIHTGMTESYENINTGIVEETLIHEAAHTSIDAYLYPERLTNGERWIEAVEKDGSCYISTYAKDYPYREDIAELFPLYIAVKYFPDRITEELRDIILSCCFNRIKYFDEQDYEMNLYEN